MPRTERKRDRYARALVIFGFSFSLLQSAAGQSDIVRNFDPGADAQRLPSLDFSLPIDSGFVFGTNSFVDLAKATALTLPNAATDGMVEGVNVWFGFKRDSVMIGTYTVEIYNGNASGGPSTPPIYRETFDIAMANADSDVDTDEVVTEHTFAQPVAVGATFFASVVFGTYMEADFGGLAIVSTPPRQARVAEDWELWLDGSWHNISDAWTSMTGAPGTGVDGWNMWVEAVVSPQMGTAIESAGGDVPDAFALSQNYPNPFGGSTTLKMSLPKTTDVTVVVYDLLGREVETLASGRYAAGVYRVTWDSHGVPDGIYLARLQAGDFERVVKLTRAQ